MCAAVCNVFDVDVSAQRILRRVLQRVSAPDCWAAGVLARDVDGHEVPPRDPRATAWSLAGAIFAECADPRDGEMLVSFVAPMMWCGRSSRECSTAIVVLFKAIELLDRGVRP